MSKKNLNFGKDAEIAAQGFLKTKGYKLLEKNYRTNLGEIDIIAKDKDTLCFIEVKARHSLRFGLPQEAVSQSKQLQISQAALLYLKKHRLIDSSCRFDIVSVSYRGDQPEFSLIKNAFPLDERFTL